MLTKFFIRMFIRSILKHERDKIVPELAKYLPLSLAESIYADISFLFGYDDFPQDETKDVLISEKPQSDLFQ